VRAPSPDVTFISGGEEESSENSGGQSTESEEEVRRSPRKAAKPRRVVRQRQFSTTDSEGVAESETNLSLSVVQLADVEAWLDTATPQERRRLHHLTAEPTADRETQTRQTTMEGEVEGLVFTMTLEVKPPPPPPATG